MSYDISLMISTGSKEKTEVAWFNHTSNTSGIWRSLGFDFHDYCWASAVDVAKALTPVIDKISESDPRDFDEYVRGNGSWGTVESTLRFLKAVRDACVEHPLTVVEVS